MNLLTDEASARLREVFRLPFAPRTLANMAWRGEGPPFHKVAGRRIYPRDALDAWATARLGPLRRSTSDEAGGQ